MKLLDNITGSMDMGFGELGVSDGRGGHRCCGSAGLQELDMTDVSLNSQRKLSE